MKNLKRVLSLLLCLIMVAGLVPATALATPTTYAVAFDSDGGSTVTAQTVESGKTATKPADPTKDGYTFKGWTYKGSPYDFSKPVAENITLYARWGTEYNITAIPTPISGQSISSDDLDSYFPSSSSYTYKNSTPYWDWYDPGVPSGVAVAGTNYYAYAIMYLEDYSAVPYEGDFVVKYAGTELSKISSTDIYKDNMKSGYRIYMYDTYNVALQVRVYLGTPTGAGNTYNIISGANGIYQKGSTADKLSFTADGNIADFIGVEVDGYLINVSDYNVESGSTIVELKKAYLESLSAGEHTLKIRYHDGEASTKFTVKDVVPTTYTVTVEKGTGDGSYAKDVTVTVTADTIPGKLFREWTTSDGVTFADSKSATTTFTMSDKDVTVTAVYDAIITVIDISGITEPVAGAVPSESFTISTTGVEVGSNTFWQVYDEATNTLKASYADSKIVNNEPFRAGTYVKLQAEVIAKEGYVFTPDTVIRYNGVELPVKDDSNLKPNFRHPVVAEHRERTAASIGWEVKNNEYTVTFDSDGGSTVAAQTVESGKTATKPADPTKTGYTFQGWYLGETAYDFATPVTGDITLKAKWEAAAPIEYAIEVSLNGYSLGGKVAYASVSESSDTVNIVTFADEKNFYIMTDDGGEPDWNSEVTEFAAGTEYWLVVGIEKENGEYLNLTDIDEDDVTLAGGCVSKIFIEDDALLACFKLKPLEATVTTTYTVTFDSDGGSAVTAQTVESGKTAAKPTDPTKSGYTFKGWYLGETEYDFATPVTGNITLKAKWEAVVVPPTTYTVTFDSDGGSAVTAQTVESGKTAAKPTDPTKSGYTFKGWYLGESEYDFATPVTDNITLKATWEKNAVTPPPVVTYTVTFDSDGGSAVTAQTVEEGKTATKPADPTKEGYTFKGWFLGETAYDFATPVTGNITLKAKWEAVVVPPTIYTATYKANGGTGTMKSEDVEAGTEYTLLANGFAAPSGKHFKCWEIGSETYAPGEKITVDSHITVKAVWEDVPNSGTSDIPQTGDNSHLLLWAVLLMTSGIGVVCLLISKKRRMI